MKMNLSFNRANLSWVVLAALCLVIFSAAAVSARTPCGETGYDFRIGSSIAANSQFTIGSRSADESPSEDDIKAWVRSYEDEITPTGGVSSPISISIAFNRIQYQTPRSANEGDRLHKVKSDLLYPVIVDYTVYQKFSDGTYPKQKKWKYEFYVNTDDYWSAFSYGPVQ